MAEHHAIERLSDVHPALLIREDDHAVINFYRHVRDDLIGVHIHYHDAPVRLRHHGETEQREYQNRFKYLHLSSRLSCKGKE